jgi:aspartate racemase
MTHAPRTGLLPLSYAQQRLWILDQLEPNNPLYNIPRTIRITGALNPQVLERVLNEIVRRHASLRTIFPLVHREPVQKILDRVALPVACVDLTAVAADRRETEARALASQEAVRPFDLTEAPLLRATLLTLAADDHVLLLTMHHIVSDAWSAAIFLEEFGILYQAFAAGQPSPLPDLSMQYADYALWQRDWLQGKALQTRLDFWRETLAGAPEVLQLRTDRPRPARQTFAGGHLQAVLPMELLDALKGMGRREGTTLFMTLLAAFQAQLAAYSGEKEIVVGTDVANRPTLETERMIGFFINLLPLRTDLSGDPTFRELLARVRETTLASYAYQDMPFDRLVQELSPERSLSHTPLVQVLFVMQNTPSPPKEFAGLRFGRFDVPVIRSKFDVAVFVHESAEGLQCHWIYSTDLFERPSVERMARHFETLLRGAVADPDIRLSALELESAEEKQQQLAASQARRRSQFESLLAAQPKPVALGRQESAGD